MFYFPYTFIIGSSLLKFIPAEALCKEGVVVGLGKWVEDPHIEERALPVSTPEVFSDNVHSSPFFTVCSSVCELLLCNRL